MSLSRLNGASVSGGRSGLDALYMGLKASIIASSCCSLPIVIALVLSVFGISGMGAAFAIPRYKNFFILLSLIFFVMSTYFSIRKKCHGSCTLSDISRHRYLVLVSSVTYVSLTVVIIYFLLPIISEFIFSISF
ncbi:hypothetical protein ACFLRF_00365 [Candidatus Altiarchaeota archaeon]